MGGVSILVDADESDVSTRFSTFSGVEVMMGLYPTFCCCLMSISSGKKYIHTSLLLNNLHITLPYCVIKISLLLLWKPIKQQVLGAFFQ